MTSKHIIIVGATSAIAEQCARLWLLDQQVRLTLVGRNLEKTREVQADLATRNPKSEITALGVDFTNAKAIRKLSDTLAAQGLIQSVLIAHGVLPDQFLCQSDLAAASEALVVNGTSPVLFAEAFAGHLQRQNSGTIILIGSVAGDRGRKSNYVYGAAKGLVTRYAQGLQHRLAKTNVKIVLVKPGPTDTPMTAKMKQAGAKLASAESVAHAIVSGAAKGHLVIYAPARWQLIMLVVRHLPRFIFNKMEF